MAHWTSSRADYEVLHVNTLKSRPACGTVQLHVRLLDGRDVQLHVATDSSVDELKRTIVDPNVAIDINRQEKGPKAGPVWGLGSFFFLNKKAQRKRKKTSKENERKRPKKTKRKLK